MGDGRAFDILVDEPREGGEVGMGVVEDGGGQGGENESYPWGEVRSRGKDIDRRALETCQKA